MFDSYLDENNKESMKNMVYSMAGFNSKHVRSKLYPFWKSYFKNLISVFDKKGNEFGK